MTNSQNDNGFYICNCGCIYSMRIPDASSEKYSFACKNCNSPIGSEEKKTKDKKNIKKHYYMIFRDKDKMPKETNENIEYKTLTQYKEEVIEPLLNSSKKGITLITKEEFLDKNITKRKISEISYRLLNFILYNHLFYANCLKYINDEYLKNNFHINDMNCIETIQSNWNLLEESLKEKGITSIQAFLNLIFKDLSELISNCELLEKESDLIQFENKVEQIVESSIKKYPE